MKANVTLGALQSRVTTALDDWHGHAGQTFLSEFIAPLPTIQQNQFAVATLLRFSLIALKEIWSRARRDIDEIARGTLTALDQLDDCGDNEWSTSFAVIGAVTAVMALPFSGAAAFGGTTIEGIAGIASNLGPKEKQLLIQGSNVPGVIDSMHEMINKLVQAVEQEQQVLVGALKSWLSP
ncbi:hypothetical protein ACFQX7_28240 [Luedemannella flava]